MDDCYLSYCTHCALNDSRSILYYRHNNKKVSFVWGLLRNCMYTGAWYYHEIMKTTWTGFFSLISSRLVILLLLGVQPWCWFTNLTLIIWITLFTLKSKLRSSTVCVNSLLLTFEAVLLPTKIHLHMFFRKGTCWNGRCWSSHSRNVPSTSYSSELKFAMCWLFLDTIFLLNGRWCHRAYTVNEVLRHISCLWVKYIYYKCCWCNLHMPFN